MGDQHSADNRPDGGRVMGKRKRRAAERWEIGALLLMAGVAFLAFAVALWFR
jgi:hypothetical protein